MRNTVMIFCLAAVGMAVVACGTVGRSTREAFAGLLEGFPNLRFTETVVSVEGDTVLVMWKAECDIGTFPQGIDTFIIRNDEIQRQTAWFHFVPK